MGFFGKKSTYSLRCRWCCRAKWRRIRGPGVAFCFPSKTKVTETGVGFWEGMANRSGKLCVAGGWAGYGNRGGRCERGAGPGPSKTWAWTLGSGFCLQLFPSESKKKRHLETPLGWVGVNEETVSAVEFSSLCLLSLKWAVSGRLSCKGS